MLPDSADNYALSTELPVPACYGNSRYTARLRDGSPNLQIQNSPEEERMHTPNLDKLASQGIKYENAYSCQPVCEVNNLIHDPQYARIRNEMHDKLLEHMNQTRDLYRGYQWAVRGEPIKPPQVFTAAICFYAVIP